MIERWLPVPSYEGFYDVSDFGAVRRLDSTIRHRSGGTSFLRGRVLKPAVGSHGYLEVVLCRDGVRRTYCVHVLVLRAFVGPPPLGMECCHKNGVRSDPHLQNLRWGTRASNLGDMREHGTHHYGSRRECGWGHLYAGANAVTRNNGGRACLACNRARAYCYGKPVMDHQLVSDWYYAKLMMDAATVRRVA